MKLIPASTRPLPSHETLAKLEAFLYVATLLIVFLGILGGWAGDAWLSVALLSLLRLPVNILLIRVRGHGRYLVQLTLLSALFNYVSTVLILYLAGRTPNPFWMLFIVEAVASGIFRAMDGVWVYTGTALCFLVYAVVFYSIDTPTLVLGILYISLMLLIGNGTYRALALLYEEQDIRSQTQEQVRQSEQRLRLITDNMLDLIVQSDAQGNLIYACPSLENVLGYSLEQVQGDSIFQRVHPEDQERALQTMAEAIRGSQTPRLEVRIRHAQGHYLWIECIGQLLFRAGQYEGAIISGRDITERKRIETALRSSLDEKVVLLKEIHHRVKNNLQVISSLLSLQASQVPDLAMRDLLRDSQDRVRSMALIHEKLYQSGNLAEINFSQYVSNLCAYLFRSYQQAAAKVDLKLEVDPVCLDIDTSVPCGLILNELVSNALKHAFPEGRSGSITIRLHVETSQQARLQVQDDGVGFSSSLPVDQIPSLGLQLIHTLADQIGADLRFEQAGGTCVSLLIPLPEAHASA